MAEMIFWLERAFDQRSAAKQEPTPSASNEAARVRPRELWLIFLAVLPLQIDLNFWLDNIISPSVI